MIKLEVPALKKGKSMVVVVPANAGGFQLLYDILYQPLNKYPKMMNENIFKKFFNLDLWCSYQIFIIFFK